MPSCHFVTVPPSRRPSSLHPRHVVLRHCIPTSRCPSPLHPHHDAPRHCTPITTPFVRRLATRAPVPAGLWAAEKNYGVCTGQHARPPRNSAACTGLCAWPPRNPEVCTGHAFGPPRNPEVCTGRAFGPPRNAGACTGGVPKRASKRYTPRENSAYSLSNRYTGHSFSAGGSARRYTGRGFSAGGGAHRYTPRYFSAHLVQTIGLKGDDLVSRTQPHLGAPGSFEPVPGHPIDPLKLVVKAPAQLTAPRPLVLGKPLPG